MDFDESAEEAAFRKEARAWLDEHAASAAALDVGRRKGEDEATFVERARPWQALLAEHGWAGITWPATYGGRGGTPAEAAIFTEEAAGRGLPTGAFAVGVGMAGPTIIAHGTDEQKARYLPPMLRGEEVWCQLADHDAPEAGRWQQHFLSAPSIRIAGGSDEIQRNVMGERVLGLPPESRVDKVVPFRELTRGSTR